MTDWDMSRATQSIILVKMVKTTDLLRRLTSSLSVLSLADSKTCKVLLVSLQASYPRAMKAFSVGWQGDEDKD